MSHTESTPSGHPIKGSSSCSPASSVGNPLVPKRLCIRTITHTATHAHTFHSCVADQNARRICGFGVERLVQKVACAPVCDNDSSRGRVHSVARLLHTPCQQEHVYSRSLKLAPPPPLPWLSALLSLLAPPSLHTRTRVLARTPRKRHPERQTNAHIHTQPTRHTPGSAHAAGRHSVRTQGVGGRGEQGAPDALASRTGSDTASAFAGGQGPNAATFPRKTPRCTAAPPARGAAVICTNASGTARPAASVMSGKPQPAAACRQAAHTTSPSASATAPAPMGQCAEHL